MTLPQPREGISAEFRDMDDLLSLEDSAIPRRQMHARLAKALHCAVLVGNPAPVVSDMWKRMSSPQPGDLVLESSTMYRKVFDPQSFGILIDHRQEWSETDAEYEADTESRELNPDWRAEDHAWYVQYGPQPEDICRWVNCDFIAVPRGGDW